MLGGGLNFLDEGGGVLKINSCDRGGAKKFSIFGIYHPPPPASPINNGINDRSLKREKIKFGEKYGNIKKKLTNNSTLPKRK
jgi:hypothetical protein